MTIFKKLMLSNNYDLRSEKYILFTETLEMLEGLEVKWIFKIIKNYQQANCLLIQKPMRRYIEFI